MARWTASAKWAEGPALDGQRDMPLALRLSEGLGRSVMLNNLKHVSRRVLQCCEDTALLLLLWDSGGRNPARRKFPVLGFDVLN